MRVKVQLHKAARVGNLEAPDLLIEALAEFPEAETYAAIAALHRGNATRLFDALTRCLPGGTIDQLLVLLLQHRASLFRVPHQPMQKE